jgi:uncharacterized protein YutE (UPF0331/DUF86 family)
MIEFSYAKGRIPDSIQFIIREIKEFEEEYNNKTWNEYQKDTKLQKLIERTVENILTALVEICGTILAEKGIAAENYSEVLSRTMGLFNFKDDEQRNIAKLAIQRNRLAHRYLDFKWQAIQMFKEQKVLVKKLLQKIMESTPKL